MLEIYAKGILHSLQNNPVVLINGARQTGKSTLVEDRRTGKKRL